MSEYPFTPTLVAKNETGSKPFAVLTFDKARLELHLNGGEVHASVEGELSDWDIRYLKAMSTGLSPLIAGLELERMVSVARSDPSRNPKLTRLVELLSIPVHHSRS